MDFKRVAAAVAKAEAYAPAGGKMTGFNLAAVYRHWPAKVKSLATARLGAKSGDEQKLCTAYAKFAIAAEHLMDLTERSTLDFGDIPITHLDGSVTGSSSASCSTSSLPGSSSDTAIVPYHAESALHVAISPSVEQQLGISPVGRRGPKGIQQQAAVDVRDRPPRPSWYHWALARTGDFFSTRKMASAVIIACLPLLVSIALRLFIMMCLRVFAVWFRALVAGFYEVGDQTTLEIERAALEMSDAVANSIRTEFTPNTFSNIAQASSNTTADGHRPLFSGWMGCGVLYVVHRALQARVAGPVP